MTDIVDSQRRSEMMARIRGRDTTPELIVRRISHGMGFRFRLHRKDLPGRPDLVFPRHRLAVFVHGCFWHQHSGCRYAYKPKSHIAFWTDKFVRNVARDRHNEEALRNLGWRVFVIWECETRDEETVRQYLARHIEQGAASLAGESRQPSPEQRIQADPGSARSHAVHRPWN